MYLERGRVSNSAVKLNLIPLKAPGRIYKQVHPFAHSLCHLPHGKFHSSFIVSFLLSPPLPPPPPPANSGFFERLSCFLIKCISLATSSSHLLYQAGHRLPPVITPCSQLCHLSLHCGVPLPRVIFSYSVSSNQSLPQPNNLS